MKEDHHPYKTPPLLNLILQLPVTLNPVNICNYFYVLVGPHKDIFVNNT